MDRQVALTKWLKNSLNNEVSLQKIADDASFRRYFRVFIGDNTLIAMDSPPDKEHNETFIKIDQWLSNNGINVPHIINYDLTQGFVLLTDFGDKTLLDQLNQDTVLRYYTQALDDLITLQHITPNKTLLPRYNQDLLLQEMQLLTQWYIPHHKPRLSTTEHQQLTQLFSQLSHYMSELPQCVVHRDYHSRNLMLMTHHDDADEALGVLDFQDAVIGAYSYDVVSLLKDVYFQLSPTHYQTLINYYHQHACPHLNPHVLIENIDFSGVQRHLKILGIFTRLSKRDHKHQYLEDIPLVKHYLMQMAEKYHCFQCLEPIL